MIIMVHTSECPKLRRAGVEHEPEHASHARITKIPDDGRMKSREDLFGDLLMSCDQFGARAKEQTDWEALPGVANVSRKKRE